MVTDRENGPTSFVYNTLEPWETRLLKVHPGLYGDDLVTNMSVAVMTFERGFGIVSEHRIVEYDALSYTWGDPHSRLQDIVCNETLFPVRQNLADALRALRDNTKSTYVWVDAICINQEDPVEKAIQIRNMKLIYGLATNVIVWLGLPQDNTKYAASFMHQLSLERHLEPSSDSEKHELYETAGETTFERREERLNRIIESFSASFVQETDYLTLHRTAHGLLELALRPWLTRIWVMQEIYAARRITVWCGSYRLGWFAFSRLDSIILILANTVRTQFDSPKWETSGGPQRSKGSADLALNENSGSVKQLVAAANSALSSITGHGSTSTNTTSSIRESLNFLRLARRRREKPDDLEDHPALSLLELLIRGSHLQASDPRDKIYALLGFTSVPTFHGPEDRTGQDGIRIDYSLSTREVFEEATTFITRYVKSSLIKPYPSDDNFNVSSDIDLPLWCPDWRQRNPCPRIKLGQKGAPYLPINDATGKGLIRKQPEYNNQMYLQSGVPKLRLTRRYTALIPRMGHMMV